VCVCVKALLVYSRLERKAGGNPLALAATPLLGRGLEARRLERDSCILL
jgi:hypothetical protein